jgi:hypothetical protein
MLEDDMSEKTFDHSGLVFYAKKNCKSCKYTPGFVSRSYPTNDGKKGKHVMKTLCHCVTEVKTPDANESVVPKVCKDALDDPNGVMLLKNVHKEPVSYASKAVPSL